MEFQLFQKFRPSLSRADMLCYTAASGTPCPAAENLASAAQHVVCQVSRRSTETKFEVMFISATVHSARIVTSLLPKRALVCTAPQQHLKSSSLVSVLSHSSNIEQLSMISLDCFLSNLYASKYTSLSEGVHLDEKTCCFDIEYLEQDMSEHKFCRALVKGYDLWMLLRRGWLAI